MPLLIRPADNRDSVGVVNVIRAVFDEYSFTWEEGGYHADLYDIDSFYTAKGHTFYVAESDGRIVGTIALERFDLIKGPLGELATLCGFVRVQGCDCSLERMYVHPEARKQGIGGALIRQVVSTATAEGRRALELWSDKRFADAHRLYGRFGARVVGERICHDPDQSPEWGLVIDLTEP
jgi:GNAT superfamily N-acetyltransferase